MAWKYSPAPVIGPCRRKDFQGNAGIAVKGLLPDLQITFTARRVSTRDSRRRDSAIVPLSVPLHCVPTDPVRRFVVDITPLGMLC
jgi:hypothetical protein